ncbi:spermatid nuclear transition protein 1 isoform X2 [Fukomys damarensis]|uniref:spermatid nuclear transition protein 1 isoform X2 n=1 Tax=Fukomys damarensis TaxID=885580 RepID=UPI00053FFB06|nr:spermatid nuclear transition protein 1 isoform X2 [Fukomys damarensis]
MSINRKSKSHGMRRGKHRTPHKGVRRGGSKGKYQKGNLKSRKRVKDANRNYRSHC